MARGLGRSYGDAAQNAGGTVLLRSATAIDVDEEHATVRASGGTSLDDLIAELLPRGLFPMVTPGTRQVTVGGAIAADVHGKNHYRDGSFADHVLSFNLVGPDGTARTITPESDAEVFWATCGGMGLTGVITRAVLRVRPVESSYLDVTSQRLPTFAALLEQMTATTEARAYAAAWVDLTARGSALGRSVLGVADHASLGQLPPRLAEAPLAPARAARVRVPRTTPFSLVRRSTVRAFDEAWFRKAPLRPTAALEHFSSFLHPLDGVEGWNRLYGPRGLVQYQFAVPDGAEHALESAAALVAASGAAPFLGVVKRLGPANPGWLSFPLAGWTLAVDFPVSARLVGLFRELDALVVGARGRVYLAKDSSCGPARVRQMYPRAEELHDWRVDSGAAPVFVSDLSRRLSL